MDSSIDEVRVKLKLSQLPSPREKGGEVKGQGIDVVRSVAWGCLATAMDELDYGILLVSDQVDALHVNEAARVVLDDVHPLQLLGPHLRARLSSDATPLRNAIHDASVRGLRQLLTLGRKGRRVHISVTPVDLSPSTVGALLVLERRSVCEPLSLDAFARGHQLTAAETRVLAFLCEGFEPDEIASRQGVAITTIRSHIGRARAKTGCSTIRALVKKISALPPLRSVLRDARHALLIPGTCPLS